MKRIFKGPSVHKAVLIIVMLFLPYFSLKGSSLNLLKAAMHLLMALRFIMKYMARAGPSY